MEWLSKNYEDIDKMDYNTLYDREITIEENKTIFKKSFTTLVKPIELKLTKKEKIEKTIEATKELNTRELESTLGVKVNIFKE